VCSADQPQATPAVQGRETGEPGMPTCTSGASRTASVAGVGIAAVIFEGFMAVFGIFA
jgi:hypothetical protein